MASLTVPVPLLSITFTSIRLALGAMPAMSGVLPLTTYLPKPAATEATWVPWP
jgi:hypothetical protein